MKNEVKKIMTSDSLRYIKVFFLLLVFVSISPNKLIQQSSQTSTYLPEIPEQVKEKSIKVLAKDIDKILNSRDLKNTNMGIAVYSIDEKKYYYKKNLFKPLTPASTTKLFTTFSALYTMGNDYDIRTTVYYTGSIKDGNLEGDIYLYGRGDALFSVSDMELLAKKIYDLGIRKISGDVYADDSYFDNITDRQAYSHDADVVEPLPPITALSIERNTATIIATSGTKGGEALHVKVIPSSESFIVDNQGVVRGSGKGYLQESDSKLNNRRNNRETILKNVGDVPPIPKSSRGSLRITTQEMKDCKQKFIVKGYLNSGRSYSFRYFIQCPALASAGALKSALQNYGIDVSGKIGTKEITESSGVPKKLAEFSRPLTELIMLANKESDNYMAENLFKIVGAYAGVRSNTSIRSDEIKRMIFDSLGIAFDKCALNDGSGLSRRNLVMAKSLITLLVKAQYMTFAEDFFGSLAIAGIDGTLYKRMTESVAENNVYGKTGTLRNVSALAGYATTMDGELLAFAFLFNGPYVYNYKIAEDKLAYLLASFFYEE